MPVSLKSNEEAKKYFIETAGSPGVKKVLLHHNQRKSVLAVLKETAQEAGRFFVDKDMTTLTENEIAGMKIENEIPGWLKEAFERAEKEGAIILFREFHEASDKIKDDVLNLFIKNETEGVVIPGNTLLVIAMQEEDESAEGVSGVRTAEFFRKI